MYEIEVADERMISADAVLRLYAAVGWWPHRTAADVAAVLEGAPAVGAWHDERLVGFARAVTDRWFRAYVEDVVVDPAYQRQGIGTALLRRLLRELTDVELVTLFAARGLTGVYERLGFGATAQVVMHLSGEKK